MAQKIQILTPEGMKIFPVYADNREMSGDFNAGLLKAGDELIYHGLVCEIVGECTDEGGCKYLELLQVGGLGNEVTFSMVM